MKGKNGVKKREMSVTQVEKQRKDRADRLKGLRKEHSLTQQQVADAIHCHVKHYASMETAHRSITRESAAALASLFHVDEAYIMCETNYRNSAEEETAKEEKFANVFGKALKRETLARDLVKAHNYDYDYVVEGTFVEKSITLTNQKGEYIKLSPDEFNTIISRINDFVEGIMLVEFQKAKSKALWQEKESGVNKNG